MENIVRVVDLSLYVGLRGRQDPMQSFLYYKTPKSPIYQKTFYTWVVDFKHEARNSQCCVAFQSRLKTFPNCLWTQKEKKMYFSFSCRIENQCKDASKFSRSRDINKTSCFEDNFLAVHQQTRISFNR